MTNEKIGVLVMSYGTPESMEQVEAYYTHIRRGNPPSPEQLEELKSRYEAIVGGVFPLRANTNRQVEVLQETLNEMAPQQKFVCYQGLKHAAPFIEDGVEKMAKDGITKAIGIVLAPHYSVMSVGSYMKRAKEQAQKSGIKLSCVESYHLHPELIDALTERVKETLQRFDPTQPLKVLFTAHSLPERILKMNDPYPQQLNETAQKVAELSGVKDWQFAWQSAGRTAEPWLGPDITEVMEQLVNEEHIKQILVCPVGFVSDHLEVLYDIDIECKQLAEQLGAHLERTSSLNTDRRYMRCLADMICRKLEEEMEDARA